MVTLTNKPRQKTYYIHGLVARAFHGPPPSPYHEVGHRDGDSFNNHVSNLRWVTRLENADDKRRHGKAQYVND